MFTLIYTKIVLALFRRAVKVSSTLLYSVVYASVRSLQAGESRADSSATALERVKAISDESQMLRMAEASEVEPEYEWATQLLSDQSVVDALTRLFTVRRVFHQWATLNDSTERVEELDKALLILKTAPMAGAVKDLPRLIRGASARLKAVRKEIATADRAEAEDAVYAQLFPKRLSLPEVAQLLGVVSFAYVLGSYLFTFTVFNRLQSKVVGMQANDYLQFATTHCLLVIPFLLFGAWIALPNNVTRAQQAYIYADFGVAPKRYTSFDIAMYVSLVGLNIPVFHKLLGMEADGWTHIVLFDCFLLILFVVRQIPYERFFEHWYSVQIALVFAIILIANMGLKGWAVAEELREPSSKQWKYQFEDGEVTSDIHSFVYEGDSSVVFYERDSEVFVVRDTAELKSVKGRL